MSKRVAYWIFNYMPEWEAASKEVLALFETFSGEYDTRLVAMNFRRRRYVFHGREKHIPLPWGLVALPFLLSSASRNDINHLFVSPGERLVVPRLSGDRTIITITKVSTPKQTQMNVPHLKKARTIVVESEHDMAMLKDAGLDEKRLKLIYPGVTTQAYREASGPFTVLFASSPTRSAEMSSRGVNLMLNVAKAMPDIRFVFAWRNMIYDELMELMASEGVTNIDVRNGEIGDMNELYGSAHATILPGLESHSFKPCPHSALESLAHGKPLLMSRPTSLARIVESSTCGVVFEPTVDGLINAIAELKANYARYQPNCQATQRRLFSPEHFFAKYRKLYDEIG